MDYKQLPPAEKFINRELSWLKFNMRVMEEACNHKHPILERLRFLSISATNLDEFYMVRVAGIRGQITAGADALSTEGLTPKQQLKQINALAQKLLDNQQEEWGVLVEALRKQSIDLLKGEDVGADDLAWLESYFLQNILPILTPLAVDPAHPFPFIPNLGFSLVLDLLKEGGDDFLMALLPIPSQLSRFIRLPQLENQQRDNQQKDKIRFISVEDILRLFIDRLFPNYTLVGDGVFRIIRDSEMEVDEEAEDLVRVFESALKRRRRGRVIRLELNADIPQKLKNMVIKELNVSKYEVILAEGIIGIGDVRQLIVDERMDLQFRPHTPRFPQRVKDHNGDCFAAIGQKEFIVHHPFESFDVVVSFLQDAATDPDVVAIKQTLYRTSDNSPIVRALIDAAEAGKTVTALVELKARFDEARNIKWARDMERAGVHVVYGFMDLKTHAKISVIIRQEKDHLHTYVHFGTGNYHPITAKIYTDLSYFTDNEALGRDAVHIFNYLTGYAQPRELEKTAISPGGIRKKLFKHIDQEIIFAGEKKPANIWVKLNSLVDPAIIEKLYEASCAGVKIELVIRGICCLRPGVKGMSENIRVKSIIGRFLEHSRIICFGNGAKMPSSKAVVYISSADWMPRNFDRRMEIMVPLENPTVHRQVLDQIMLINLKDNVQSWQLLADHSYQKIETEDEPISAHEYFLTNPSLSGTGTYLEKDKNNG
jgi:polyphosphate kinase